MNIPDRIDASLRGVAQLDRRWWQGGGVDPSGRSSDRFLTGTGAAGSLDKNVRIVFGRIVDGVSPFHWYKVQTEGAKAPIACSVLSSTSLLPFGVRDHNPLSPGAGVWLILHPQSIHGVIIGVDPPLYSGSAPLADAVSQASRNGVKVDQAHSFPFSLTRRGCIVDWSSGRPSDGTLAGEKGWLSELGVGVFVDSLMAFLRADENCGFWAFYEDQLARLRGHNLQIDTGGSSYELLDDQGEIREYRGTTPYPWEQLGFFSRAAVSVRTFTAHQSQADQPHYAKYEPLFDDQQSFHRLREYGGYSGSVSKKLVVLPPVGAVTANRYSDRSIHPGVFEEQLLANGGYCLRSAKSVSLVKSFLLPVPKAVRRPEDPSGDTPSNYKFSGLDGEGVDHQVLGSLAAGAIDPQMVRAAGDLDSRTAATNWDGQLGLMHHAQDTYLPEESEVATTPPATDDYYGRLAGTSAFLEPPEPVAVPVDHREPSGAYYNNSSDVNLLEDGGVTVNDAFGGSIRMTGGNMYLAPPGDLILQPGRRVIILAGKDCIIRAVGAAEISTTQGDVRIASGRHAYLAAEGGVLVESRSTGSDFSQWKDRIGDDCGPTGIILRSPAANVTVWSNTTYISATSGIDLDAGAGTGSITSYSSSFTRYTAEAKDHFGSYSPEAQRTDATSSHSASGASFAGDVFTGGSILCSGSAMARTGFFTPDGDYTKGKDPGFEEQARDVREDLDTDLLDARTRSRTADLAHRSAYSVGLHGETGAGNADVIAEAGFSFRTSRQYGAEDFRIFENRWQQRARAWGSDLPVWREGTVPKSGAFTAPFPGYDRSREVGSFFTQDLQLFDLSAGRARDRDSAAYKEAKHGTPTAQTLDGGYPIIG